MATTIDEICGFLGNAGLKFRRIPDRPLVATGFATEYYRDSDGDSNIGIVIELEENGEFLKVFTPRAYSYKEGPHKEALFQALLHVSWRTKMVQFEYDAEDGEVRAIIEFPLEDALLTQRQLLRVVSALAQIVDEFHHEITAAIEQGALPESRGEVMRAFAEFMRQRRAQAGGAGLSLAE